MKLSDNGFNKLKEYEGFRESPYIDSVGVPTIGYGFTYYLDGKKVTMADPKITPGQADIILRQLFTTKYEMFIPKNVNQNQFDALGLFIFNVGVKNFRDSTLFKKVLVNPNDETIRSEFLKWNKGTINGKKVPIDGLTNRRKKEADLYFTPVAK